MNKVSVKRGLKTVAKAVAVAAFGFVGSAHAAMDTTSVTSALTDAGTAGGVIGAAVLVLVVGIKSYKYVRMAL